MIDHRFTFVGSLNLDPRSLDLNSEMGIMVDVSDVPDEFKDRVEQLRAAAIDEACNYDDALLEKHAEELKLLFSPLFPELTTNNEIKAACMPFFPFFLWHLAKERE